MKFHVGDKVRVHCPEVQDAIGKIVRINADSPWPYQVTSKDYMDLLKCNPTESVMSLWFGQHELELISRVICIHKRRKVVI